MRRRMVQDGGDQEITGADVENAAVFEQVSIENLSAIAAELGLHPEIADHGGEKALGCHFPSGPGMVFLYGTRDFEPAFGFVTIRPGAKLNVAQVNAWNAENGFGTMFTDSEGTPWLRHSVLLRGGVTRDFLCYQFGLFDMMIKSFVAATS
jgi:hypothetical protein